MKTETPRTDAIRYADYATQILSHEQLECELNEAQRKWKSEVGYLRAQLDLHKEVRTERDQWRAVAQELGQVLKAVSWHRTATKGLFRAFGTYHVEQRQQALARFNELNKLKQITKDHEAS